MTELTAYEIAPEGGFTLVTAPYSREWMEQADGRISFRRCLPLLMANQSGWLILNPVTVRVRWDGGPTMQAVEIQRWQVTGDQAQLPEHCWPISHFGEGILTWTLPFLFRTSPGYNLLARGPANEPHDGVCPLEGLIETDWAVAPFTMNWKITRPDTWITFEQGESIAMVVPQRRGELEEFVPRMCPIETDSVLDRANLCWGASRDQFNVERQDSGSEAARRGWEKHYFQGTSPDGTSATEHQLRRRLRQFVRR